MSPTIVPVPGRAGPTAEFPYSKSQINKAGGFWREFFHDPFIDEHDGLELPEAARRVWAWRGSFQVPLTKVAAGLRQFVKSESTQIIVAQRLKRLPTIIEKLSRLPDSQLARMEDIGGCRAVLPGGRSEIEGVLRRIRKNWAVKRERDYVAEPKHTGYRGVHVVVERDARRIEIQLRTPGQQDWADMIERFDGRLGSMLKDGRGPDVLLRYVRLAGEGIAYEDAGEVAPLEFEEAFRQARDEALEFLREG